MALADFRTRTREIASVPSSVVGQGDNTAEDRCITDAVREYSIIRPRELWASVAAVGGTSRDYVLTTAIAGWVDDTYTVLEIVYPLGETSEAVQPRDDWQVRLNSSNQQIIRFIRNNPAAGYNIGVKYGLPHSVTGSTDTISSGTGSAPGDFDALSRLAASRVLEIAASFYADKANAAIGADSVDYRAKSDIYHSRAKEMRDEAYRHFRMKPQLTSARINMYAPAIGGGNRQFWRRDLTR